MMKNNTFYEKLGLELSLGKLLSKELIQSLWSDYGELLRLKYENKSIILKHIKLPEILNHPRAWNSKFSHERKINSYKVEINWYKNFSKNTDENCFFPKGLKYLQTDDEYLLVMEDLKEFGFEITTKVANKNHLKACIFWLANFHAKNMNKKSDLLWEIGTYWHLDTRPDEFEVLEENDLKKYAKKIDEKLNNAKYQTIVHGDAKLANFCFTKDDKKCAAVDFQYVGQGCGIKDLAYFISSAVLPQECKKMEKWLLDKYFEYLKKAIEQYNPKLNSVEIEKEYRSLYPYAWADFQRFLKGWSPNHFKINDYLETLTKQVLTSLKIEKN